MCKELVCKMSVLKLAYPGTVSEFLGGTPTSVCHFFCLSVCGAPFLKNCTPSNHNFWCTYVKS